jgi:hypothetical protein
MKSIETYFFAIHNQRHTEVSFILFQSLMFLHAVLQITIERKDIVL